MRGAPHAAAPPTVTIMLESSTQDLIDSGLNGSTLDD
jgi:hypothetical protein